MNDDGTGRVKLTTFPQEDTIRPWYAYKAGPPIWHPSGDFISYQSYQTGKYRLFAVSPDGQQNWQLLDLEYNVGFHNWSPDGKWLTLGITDSSETNYNVGLINWETKALKILTNASFKYQQAPVFVVID